ncbi:MAG: c-type cytochrome, partial [Desulfatitalea sp.]
MRGFTVACADAGGQKEHRRLPVAGHEHGGAAATTVPFSGGELFYRTADPDTLQPPFDLADPNTVAQGRQGYRYYCIQCHGVNWDGYGTVGQSFASPPGDLRSARVQNLPVGRVFHEISYGIPGGRQPALASTIAPHERWQIIAFI